jgi:GNAT superfamily N-acetyltransferase
VSLERYSAVIRDQQRSVDRLVRDSGERRVRRVLEDILRDLTHQLERVPADSYNMTILTALRGQVQAAMVRFVAAGGDALGTAAGEAMTQAARESFATLARLETQFTGAAITLPLREIGRLRGLESGRRPSVLRHYRRSMSRYGAAVVMSAERDIATGLALGEGQSKIIDRVQGSIDGEWYQAERIVRTELSGAYNTTHREAIEIESEAFADEGGVWAQWSEHCDDDGVPRDNRVAVDSIAMHGQVVRSGQLFVMPPTAPHPDAKGNTEVPASLVGRTWSAPPNRPNDRSVVAPWRPHWGIPGWQWVGGQRVPVTEDEPAPRARPAAVPDLRSEPPAQPASEPRRSADDLVVVQTAEPPPPGEGVARTVDAVEAAKAKALTEEMHALDAVRRATTMPMAKALHPSVKIGKPVQIGDFTAPIDVQGFEAGLEKMLGKRISLEEISHAYAPPPGFTGEIRMAFNDADAGMLNLSISYYDATTGELAGKMDRDFYGDGVVSHSSLYLEKKYQGAKFAETLNGQALLRYKKWGIKQIDLTAADVGRYAWARLGFNIVDSSFTKSALAYIDEHVEPGMRAEYKEKLRLLKAEPWKLAKWDEGKPYPVRPSKHIKAGEHPIGKAILLDANTEMWSGTMRIDDDNPGYRNALRLLNVAEKK